MPNLIVGFGEALVDILPGGEVIGGAPLNFSVRAAELGARLDFRTAMVTRIGDDQRGKQVLRRLAEAAVDCSAVQIDQVLPTGTVDVRFISGQPEYSISAGVAWDEIAFDAAVQSLAQSCKAVCFGTLAQRNGTTATALRSFLGLARDAIKVFDLNLRRPWPAIEHVHWSLEKASILKCNSEELYVLGQWFPHPSCQTECDIAHHLQSLFDLQAIFWTRGERGCCWLDRDELIESPVPQFAANPGADSVGAGDAACAALVVGIVAGWHPQRIVSAANTCGAFVVSQPGATQPLAKGLIDALVAETSMSR